MSINGSYVMHVSCDAPECCAKSNLTAKGSKWIRSDEARAKNYAQARMQLVRDGWKIRKNKAICPVCISAGLRMRDLDPRRKKPIAKETTDPQGPGATESPASGAVSEHVGTDTPGVSG